jgi:hypothetical protein
MDSIGTPPDQSTISHRRRSRRRLAFAGVALTLLAVVMASVWHWRTHPSAFHPVPDTVSSTWRTGHDDGTMYLGMSDPGDNADVVQLDSVHANVSRNTADATIEFLVCTMTGRRGITGIGSVRQRDLDRDCPHPRPVTTGTELDVRARPPHQQIVMAVTPHQAGAVLIDGAVATYRQGWQHGSQVIGERIRLTLH